MMAKQVKVQQSNVHEMIEGEMFLVLKYTYHHSQYVTCLLSVVVMYTLKQYIQ